MFGFPVSEAKEVHGTAAFVAGRLSRHDAHQPQDIGAEHGDITLPGNAPSQGVQQVCGKSVADLYPLFRKIMPPVTAALEQSLQRSQQRSS